MPRASALLIAASLAACAGASGPTEATPATEVATPPSEDPPERDTPPPDAPAERTVRYECALVTPWGGLRGPAVRVDLERGEGWRRPAVRTPPLSEPQAPTPHDAPWPRSGESLSPSALSALRSLTDEVAARDDWPEQTVPPETELCRLHLEASRGRPARSWQRRLRGSGPPGGPGAMPEDAIDRLTDALLALPLDEN